MKDKKVIIILGVNADIGKNIAKYFLNENYFIIGTYRKKKPSLKKSENLYLIKCDINKEKDLKKIKNFLKIKKIQWNTLFSSIGTTVPIGNFFNLSFNNWKKSIFTNFISQLNVLHELFPLRKKTMTNVIFLAGGGTNNPFTNYSAYCVSKIALIKMCELLDDEIKNLNIFILGPGFTKTKTHFETLKAGKLAGKNFKRVKNFLKSKQTGTTFKEIFNSIKWGIKSGKKIASGRNFSVVHDKLGTKLLESKLKLDKNMYKLRRYKN